MRNLLAGMLVLMTAMFPAAMAQDECVPTSADPATITQVDDPVTGETYYIEERDPGVPTDPPIPFSGFLTGNGTWTWKETNGYPGLQRGGGGPFGEWWPPFCDPDWYWDPSNPTVPSGVPCLIIDEDPIQDEHCGYGGDTLVL